MGTARTADEAIKRALISGAFTKILTIGLTMATLGMAARSLGPVNFGIVSIFVAAASFFGFLDLGLGSAAINPLSTALATGKHAEVRRIVSTLLASLIVVSFVIAVALVLSSFVVADVLAGRLGMPNRTILDLCLTLTGIACFGLFAAAGPKIGTALQRSDWNAGALLAAAVLSAILSAVGWAISAPPAWFLASLLGPAVVVNLGLTALLLRSLPLSARPVLGARSLSSLRALAGRGQAYMVLVLVSAVSFQSGPLIIGALLPPQEVGVFAITARLFSVVSSIYAIGLQQVWGSLASHFASRDLATARALAWKWGTVVLLSAAALSVAIFIFGRPFVRVWAGQGLVPPYGLLAVSAIWSVYVILMTYLGSILNAAGRVGIQAVANVVMAAVSIPLGAVLTEKLGSPGVIIAMMVTHLVFVAPVVLRATHNAFANSDSIRSGDVKQSPR